MEDAPPSLRDLERGAPLFRVMQVHRINRSNDAMAGPSTPRPHISEAAEGDGSSISESVPGEEFPAAVYRTIVIAFAWMMLAAWLAFGGAAGTDLDLAIATVLCTVLLGIPFVLRRTAGHWLPRPPQVSKPFRKTRIAIATGTISGREAWLQVILIPVALAVAATLIGGVNHELIAVRVYGRDFSSWPFTDTLTCAPSRPVRSCRQ